MLFVFVKKLDFMV